MNQNPFGHRPHFGVLGWKRSGLGVTAEIAGYSLDQQGKPEKEVYRDTVKLYDGKQRRKFGNEFFNKLPVKSEDNRTSFVDDTEKHLKKIADRIRKKEADAATPKKDPQPPAMTDDERNQALALLNNPHFLERT